MKLLRGFALIFAFLFLGHILSLILPLPMPAPVLGMALLFLALCLGLVKEEWIQDAAEGLIAQMMIMFIPGGVKILNAYDKIAGHVLSSVLVCIISSICVLMVTSFTTDQLISGQLRRLQDEDLAE